VRPSPNKTARPGHAPGAGARPKLPFRPARLQDAPRQGPALFVWLVRGILSSLSPLTHQLISVRGPGQKSAPAGSLQGSCKGVQRNGHHGTTAQFIQSFESELVMTASKLQKPCIFPQRHLQYHRSMYARTVGNWGGGIQ